MWSKLMALLAGIPVDKYLHFIAGLIISAFFCITLGMKVCIVPTIFAGFIKEFVDEWRYGGFDWYDLLATCLGGLIIQLFAIPLFL